MLERKLRKTLKAIFFVCLAASFFPAASNALPITLYDRPLTDPWWDLSDNSGLTKLILTAAEFDLSTPWSLKWNVTNGSIFECNTYDVHLEWMTGYTKTFSQTTNTTVNGELTAEFKGIGAKIGASYSSALTIGESMSKIEKASIDTKVTLCCLQNGKYYTNEIYDLYSGTFQWFDDVGPHVGGNTEYGTWSAVVYHGHGLNGPVKTGGVPCIPEPSTCVLFGLGLVGIVRVQQGRKIQ